MIKEFTVPDFDQEDLRGRLSNIKWPNEYEDTSVNWEVGTPTWAVKEMVDYWKNNYSWKAALEEINGWKHYKAKIDDLNIHFVHERSSHENAIPIVLLHGWPSTFYEFHKIIAPLRDNPIQPFHVVVPSLPAYGFSDAPKSPGFSVTAISDTMNKLMIEIGYDKYMVFGTDWGAFIGNHMAKNYLSNVIGFLTVMPSPPPPLPTMRNMMCHPIKVLLFIIAVFLGLETIYGKKETRGLGVAAFANVDKCEGAGYRAIQSTRPYTLSYGLSDSPVGLLGWMLEKYHEWTFHEPSEVNTNSVPKTISPDEFLTQVTIYWMTNSMSSSYRLYHEVKRDKSTKAFTEIASTVIKVPYAVSYFANEITKFPRDWIEAHTEHLVQYKQHDKGGHFAALEEPELLSNDIIEFGSKLSHTSSAQQKKNV